MQSVLYHSGYGYSKRLCEDVTSWFLNRFLPRHKIEVEILHRGLKRESVYGWCGVIDCDWRPRSFLIEIHNGLNKEDYIKTLLHEMQHILQHIRGDLRDKRGIRCWKDIDCSELDYENCPWEIEAHQREQELYEEYKVWWNNGFEQIRTKVSPGIDWKKGKLLEETYWWNDGEKNFKSKKCPGDNWSRGLIKKKTTKNLEWWNDGVKNTMKKECPGNGWKRGMIKNVS